MSSFLLTATLINIMSLAFTTQWPLHPVPTIQYGFKTAPNSNASTVTSGSSSVHTVTLYWNGYTFQCDVIPQKPNTYYLCDSSTSSLCNISSNITYGLQIDNIGSDESIITEIIIIEMLQIQILNTIILNQFCFNQTNFGWKRIDSNDICISASQGSFDTFLFGHRNNNQHIFFDLTPSINTNEIYPKLKNKSVICNNTEWTSNCLIYDQNYKPNNPNINYNTVIKTELSYAFKSDENTETQLNCTGINNICYIHCLTVNSCQQLQINKVNMYVPELIVNCTANLACQGAIVNISNSNIDSLKIYCHGLYSCKNMHIILNDITADLIYIQCVNKYSCKSVEIILNQDELNGNSYIENVLIECENKESCTGNKYVCNNTNVRNTVIICSQYESCYSVDIETFIAYDGLLSMHCIGLHSCKLANVYLEMVKHSKIDYKSYFVCYDRFSCNNVVINSDSVKVNMNMYEYSSNINIGHNKMELLHITCDDKNNQKFIEYYTNKIKTKNELLKLVSAQYTDSLMPCQGITVNCGERMHSCDMTYRLKSLNISKIMDASNECILMGTTSIFQASTVCHTSCFEYQLFEYTQLLDLDIIVNMTNGSLFCEDWFVTQNIAEKAFSEINAIFENILDSLDRYEIYYVSQEPMTHFRNISQFNCDYLNDSIGLRTRFWIESFVENETEFHSLFDDNSLFVNKSEQLLSMLFDVPVLIKHAEIETKNIETTKVEQDKESDPQEDWQAKTGIIIAIVLFVMVCIIWIIGYYCHQFKIEGVQHAYGTDEESVEQILMTNDDTKRTDKKQANDIGEHENGTETIENTCMNDKQEEEESISYLSTGKPTKR